jgi:hypothetical protein
MLRGSVKSNENARRFALCFHASRVLLKCDGTRAETRFRLSAKRTSPFNSTGASVQTTTGSRGVRICGSNAGHTMLRGSVKSTGYLLHSPVSPSLPLPCVTVCHHICYRRETSGILHPPRLCGAVYHDFLRNVLPQLLKLWICILGPIDGAHVILVDNMFFLQVANSSGMCNSGYEKVDQQNGLLFTII